MVPLPSELWLKIFRGLDEQSDRAACCRLSRDVYFAAREALYERVTLRGTGCTSDANLGVFAAANTGQLCLQELALVDILSENLESLNLCLEKVQRARRVRWHRAILNDNALANTDERQEGLFRKHFFRLNPESVRLIDSAFLWRFLSRLPLRVLEVNNSDMSDGSIEIDDPTLLLPQVSDCILVALDEFSSVYFFWLRFLPNLTELTMHLHNLDSPKYLFPQLPATLKRIRLDCDAHMNQFSELGLTFKVLTARCPHLEELTLSRISFGRFFRQQWVLPPSVHTVHLANCEEVGLTWLRQLIPRMIGLRKLHLSVFETDFETQTRLESEWQASAAFREAGVDVQLDLVQTARRRQRNDESSSSFFLTANHLDPILDAAMSKSAS